MLASEMSEASVSLAVSSRDSHIISNLECQKITQNESSPPDLFNNSSSLKYLHKKFKRVASTVIEDNCAKVNTNVNNTSSACASTKFNANVVNNVNGGAFSDDAVAVAVGATTAAHQSHINKSAANHSHASEIYSANSNVPAKRDHNLVKNESDSNHRAVVGVSGNHYGLSKENNQQSHKSYAMDFSDGINKCKNDAASHRASTHTQKNIGCEQLPEDFRIKAKASSRLQNFGENLVRNAEYNNLTVKSSANADVKSVYSGIGSGSIESGNAFVKSKVPPRRKNNERPNQCATCGIELKSKSQLYKHCRCVFRSNLSDMHRIRIYDIEIFVCVCMICFRFLFHF